MSSKIESGNSRQGISLYDLNLKIRDTLNSSFDKPLWVVAELSEMKVHRSGHCYLELIQKDKDSDRIIAKSRATIWAYTYRILKPYFESTTGYEFSTGIQIMVNVRVDFHELYGLSLHIEDIDPTYTLGDMERRKREILRKLEEDGVLDMNKELGLPLIPRVIAVISSETAAGYEDFHEQLSNNPYGYVFHTHLFNALMQGDQSPASIMKQLERIYEHQEVFDLVVIIRGGGSQADLASLNHYELASHIAQFPLPVLTGIGHEKDDTVLDIVAHTRLKTPTAVAEFLIERIHEFEEHLHHLFRIIKDRTRDYPDRFKNRIEQLALKLQSGSNMKLEQHKEKLVHSRISLMELSRKRVDRERNNLKHSSRYIQSGSMQMLKYHRQVLGLSEKSIEHLSPKNVLKRGYSITRHKGRSIKEAKEVGQGETIETQLHHGDLTSITTGKKKRSE